MNFDLVSFALGVAFVCSLIFTALLVGSWAVGRSERNQSDKYEPPKGDHEK